MNYIVTGGCGFIGSNFVNYLCDVTDEDVFVVDKMTYAASETNIDLDHLRSGQVRIYKCDLAIGCEALDKILEHTAEQDHVTVEIENTKYEIGQDLNKYIAKLEKKMQNYVTTGRPSRSDRHAA